MKAPLLVTGANSFIGSNLIRCLVRRSECRIVATYRNNKEALINPFPNHLKYVPCDLSDINSVSKIFKTYDIKNIIHLAAAIPSKSDQNYTTILERDNIVSLKNLLELAKDKGCKRFVFTSSISVYEGLENSKNELLESLKLSPKSIYGQSKLNGEKLLSQYSGVILKGVSLRFSGVHGPGKLKGVVYNFIKAALAQAPLNILEPNSCFSFLFVDDAIQSILLALNKDLTDSYCCYNVAGKESLSILELAKLVVKITKSKSILNVAENKAIRNQVLSLKKVCADFDFMPSPLLQNLLSYLKFLKEKKEGCV